MPPLGEATSDAAGHYQLRPVSPPSRAHNFVRLVCRLPDGRPGGLRRRRRRRPAQLTAGCVARRPGGQQARRAAGRGASLYECGTRSEAASSSSKRGPVRTRSADEAGRHLHAGRSAAGGHAYLKAKHPRTDEGGRWYVPTKAGDNAAGDIVVRDGISVEGVVRDAETGRPVGGAEVRAVLYGRTVLGTAKSNADGVYRLEGLSSSIGRVEVEATAAGANGAGVRGGCPGHGMGAAGPEVFRGWTFCCEKRGPSAGRSGSPVAPGRSRAVTAGLSWTVGCRRRVTVIPDPPVGSLQVMDGTGTPAWTVKAPCRPGVRQHARECGRRRRPLL